MDQIHQNIWLFKQNQFNYKFPTLKLNYALLLNLKSLKMLFVKNDYPITNYLKHPRLYSFILYSMLFTPNLMLVYLNKSMKLFK